MPQAPAPPPPAATQPDAAPPAGVWRLGPWTFEGAGHVLRRRGEARRLEPKAAAVLAALLRRPGRVVGRDELLAAAWPGLYVTEEVLTNAVYELRRALGDDARQPRYIETIPRRGYRLLAEAVALDGRRVPGRRRAAWVVAATVVAVLVTALAGWQRAGHGPEEPGGAAGTAGETAAPAVAARRVAAGRRALDAARPGAPLAAMEEASLALAADPRSAAAWSLAAAAWAEQVAEGAVAAGEGWARSRPFLERALALDPDEPDALTTRAFLRWLAQWDWAGAEADLARAIAAHPGAAAPRALRSELWVFSGRVAGAEQEAAAAVVRAPRSPRIRLTAGMVAALAGDEEEAHRHYRAVLELDPEHPRARRQLAKLAAPRPAPRDEPAGELGPGELEALAAKGRMSPGVVAVLYAEAGAADQALDWLERAVAAHDATVLFFPFDPRWEPWRDHPRYREAMGRLRRPLPTVS